MVNKTKKLVGFVVKKFKNIRNRLTKKKRRSSAISPTRRASPTKRTTKRISTLRRLGITTPTSRASSPTRRHSSSPRRRRLSSSPTRRLSSFPGYVFVSAQGTPKKIVYPVVAATNANGAEVSEIELGKNPVSQIGNNRLGPNLNERHNEQKKYCFNQMNEEDCNKEKAILKTGDKNLCRWDQERKKCVINKITYY